MAEKRFLRNSDILETMESALDEIPEQAEFIYGVPRGGIPVAYMLAGFTGGSNHHTELQVIDELPREPISPLLKEKILIVDDLIDSGATKERFQKMGFTNFFGLYDKQKDHITDWLVFPWEVGEFKDDESATDIVTRLFEYIGEDPSREGLKDTPKRFLAAWDEWASGYGKEPEDVLKVFEDGAEEVDEMVIVHDIPIVSKCEHHLADIIGTATVGYIPDGKIIGLSKIPRLVEIYARRLQVQERLTSQIANALWASDLAPLGVGVIIKAAHHCMSTRGVRIHGSTTTTSSMKGVFMEKPECRAEFLRLAG